MNDGLAMAWLQQNASHEDHRNDPEYKALSPEGQRMVDDFLCAFHSARTPDEFGKLFFADNEEEEQEDV